MTHSFIKDIRGMTLIDIAVSMMVLGLLAVPLIKQYDLWRAEQARNTTIGSTQMIDIAIEDFYFLNGRYPCPAIVGLLKDDVNYGKELCEGTDQSDAVDDDGVLVGGVPFVTLKIPIENSLDGWKNRLTYAVTMAYSDENSTFTSGIDFGEDAAVQISRVPMIPDPLTSQIICDPAGPQTENVHYTLVSHGESGTGAYSTDGKIGKTCPEGSDATTESDNCNGDATFSHQQCIYNTSNSLAYFDDYLNSRSSAPTRLWPDSTVDASDAVTQITRIGVGEFEPIFELDVIGNMKVDAQEVGQDGNAYLLELCTTDIDGNLDPTTCFRPEQLTGYEPSMQCENRKIMKGVAENSTNCATTYFPGNASDNCNPTTEFMIGIDQNGVPICTPR